MSKYTTQVRFICESYANKTPSVASNVDEIIEAARGKIFDFNYPIFDESYRKTLETKILKHFYTREIGFESIGLWKLKLNMRMNEIMPYYNKLYLSELLEYNPLSTTDYTREETKSNKSTREDDTSEDTTRKVTGTASQDTNGTNKFSDTPQGSISNLANDTYLTNATIVNEDKSSNSTTTETGKRTNGYTSTDISHGSNTEHYSGYSSVDVNKLLKSYRDNLLNIDLLVIRDLENLFFILWE